MCTSRFAPPWIIQVFNKSGLQLGWYAVHVSQERKRHISGRKKAHKHKLFALVNVQMALGQTAGCPKVNRAKKFMCSPRNTGNINFSLWLTGGLSQGCPDFQKVYVFKVSVPFSCPNINMYLFGRWPLRWPGGSPDREDRGQSFMCYPRNPRNINLFVRIPDREDRWPGRPEKKFMCKFLCRWKPKGDGGNGTAKTYVTTICDKRHDNWRHFTTTCDIFWQFPSLCSSLTYNVIKRHKSS